MRRGAVTFACCSLFALWFLACRETILLPATATSGTGGTGSGGDLGNGFGGLGGFPLGSDGRGGAQANGGTLGGGGRLAGGGAGMTGGTMGGGGRGGNCRSPQRVSVAFWPAQVLILLEKSASMGIKFGPSDSRLTVVQQTLSPLVGRNKSAVYFGYQEFPGTTSCSSVDGCCGVKAGALIPPSPTSGLDVEQALTCQSNSCASTLDSRPVAAAYDSASKVFDDPNYGGERYVLLLVDGEPFCSSVTGDQCEDAAIKRSRLETNGAKLTVIGVGPDVQAGGCLALRVASANRPLVRATTPNELTTELGIFMKSAARAVCTLTIRNSPQGVDAKTLAVAINGQSIDANPESGWTLLPGSPARIQLNGEACTLMQEGVQTNDVDVEACQQQQQP